MVKRAAHRQRSACSAGPCDRPKRNASYCVRGSRRYSLQAQGDLRGIAPNLADIYCISSTPRSFFCPLPTSAVDDHQHQIGQYCPNLGLSQSVPTMHTQKESTAMVSCWQYSSEQKTRKCLWEVVPRDGIEPPTRGFSVRRSIFITAYHRP